MQIWKRAFARALLLKTFGKLLLKQLYLKLTKITRRSRGPRAFLDKLRKGCDFLKDMSRYNWEVIRRSRHCLEKLAEENVQEVSVYGESDVVEILHDLTFELPVKIKTVYENYRRKTDWGNVLPVDMMSGGREKVIIASLVNIDERLERLSNLGIDRKRIVLLS